MTTTKTHRIGPRMTQACKILLSKGGTMTGKHSLAVAVGPHGSNAFGDRIVMRCCRAGLIELSGDPYSRQGYTLTLTEDGHRVATFA